MKLISIAGLCAALYAGAGALLWAAQDRLIFHPRAVHPDKRRQFENLQVQFPMPDGAILRGWMRPADAPPPENAPCRLILYFGGNSEEVSANIQHPLPVPADQLLINYRGFGDSDGKPSNRDLEQDALRLFDQAADRFAIPPEKICVFGRSLGTHMAAFVAAHRPVARVVLISPFDSVLSIAQRRYPVFPVRMLLRHPFATGDFAEKVRAPTLFILAENDWIVPRRRSDALIQMWKAPRQIVVVPNSTHNDFDAPEYRRAVYDFLSEQ